MGYSHLYRLLAPVRDRMPEIASTFREALKMMPDTANSLRDPSGICAPIITDEGIWFNGDAGRGEDYEEFHIASDCPVGRNCYCKTGRRPYDLAVCLCLIVLKDALRDDFKFRSDGVFLTHRRKDGSIAIAEENWIHARFAYDRYCRSSGKEVPDYCSWGIDNREEY